MRLRWTISVLVMLAVAAVWVWLRESPEQAEAVREAEEPRTIRNYGAANNPLSPHYVTGYDSNLPHYVHHSITEGLLSRINPEWLEKYEGSYTWDDLYKEDEESSLSVSLKSKWLVHNQNAPQAGIHVERNPATGNYEVSGGEVFLPKPGVGVSYEKDESTGETKTYFNLKREF